LSTAGYAQDPNNNGGTTPDQTNTAGQSQTGDNSASDAENTAQQPAHSSEAEDSSDADILNGPAQGQSVLEGAAKEDSTPDPEEETYPGAPLPPGVAFGHSYSEQLINNGVCSWYVVTYLLFADGHSEWRHYDTKIICSEPKPPQLTQGDSDQMLQLLFPTRPDIQKTVEELRKTLEKDPGAADDLGLGKGTDKPALADPHADQRSQKTENKRTELTRDEAMNKSGEKVPATEQKSKTAEDRSSAKSNGSNEHTNVKLDGKTVQRDSKSSGNTGQSSKSVGVDQHSMRTVMRDQPVASQRLAHVGKIARIGEVRTEGMHEMGSHMGGLGGMHVVGLGALGGLSATHMSGLGGLGGMRMGGMGGFGRR